MSRKSKQRVDADNAFLRTQTQALSRSRNLSEADSAMQLRDANTAKLKEQRLQKEAIDRETAAAAPPKPKGRQRVSSP